ncbi:MAG: glycerol-3-phosphate dehydrogenase/oxidase [Chloroflexi bacterium]|jgi:glycerol-3-phosphate dehydrogenase|nr:glycerol-3-phosphate dehydrogenase/oxidase [Chloroflexota bacterium]
MSQVQSREQLWSQLDQDWDLIVIGGGITGAGVFRRAVSGGYKTLLLEAADFSSGTSSKSSKLVHGGFRYLRSRQFDVTFESVRQREKLLKQAQNLVTLLGFVLPHDESPREKRLFRGGVTLYDLMAPKWRHRHLNLEQLHDTMPILKPENMAGAYFYYDALVDDSRMVLRLIQETCQDGGLALNYARVTQVLKDANARVRGVAVEDRSRSNHGTLELKTKAVINATGPWTDQLRQQLGRPDRVRPLRGSHLVFSFDDLPIPNAVTLMHPNDGRAMFAIPWEGRTIFGTTDLDHPYPLEQEPFCTDQEISYMLEAIHAIFPGTNISETSVLSSFAGLRPIVRGDANNPSAESRAHLVLEEDGLVTITGGKLTIFELMAEDALKTAARLIGKNLSPIKDWFKPIPADLPGNPLAPQSFYYLAGRYGQALPDLLEVSTPHDLTRIDDLYMHWAELLYNAHFGMVEHLDDLLLRHTRLGLLLPNGAMDVMDKIQDLTAPHLPWSDDEWRIEISRYQQIYLQAFSPNPGSHLE